MRRILLFSFVLCLISTPTFAFSVIDQTGNLLTNGNFETGVRAPWHENDFPTTAISSFTKIDGDFSIFVDTTLGQPGGSGDWACGIYQYPGALPDEIYTASAWVYPITGNAYLGLASISGVGGASSPTSVYNEWVYLEYTRQIDGGPFLYGASNEDQFYVDGVWLNRGEVNLSPYSPRNGFENPNIIPEPSSLLLLSLGGLLLKRRKR